MPLARIAGSILLWSCGLQLAMAAAEPLPDPDATPLDPVEVTPGPDPLFEPERRLRRLLEDAPCLGCDVKPSRPPAHPVVELLRRNFLPQEPPPPPDDPADRAVQQSMERQDRKLQDKHLP